MGFWAKCWVSGWMEWIPHRLLWLLKHLQYNCTAQFHKTVFLHNQQRLLTSCYSGWWSPSQSTTSSSVMTFDQLLFRLVVPIPVYKIILHNIIFSNDLWPVTIQVCGSYPSLQDHLAQQHLQQWLSTRCYSSWWSSSVLGNRNRDKYRTAVIAKIIATAFSLRYFFLSNCSLFLDL